jgi:D-glycero-D-manno-heptose 1,7-bisphosphate phosphatase
MVKAVFLDRDGVINRLVFNETNGEFEPPHRIADLSLYPWTIESLRKIIEYGFDLFLVSNQPDYAKGKCSLEDLKSVHERLDEIFRENKIFFREYYYCYHHPAGIVPGYSGECTCRKPSPFFLKKAEREYGINMKESWMIGDREADILCGRGAGVRTIMVKSEEQKTLAVQNITPDFSVNSLSEAVNLLINKNSKGRNYV